MTMFAQLVVATSSAIIAGVVVALFEKWLEDRNDKNKKE